MRLRTTALALSLALSACAPRSAAVAPVPAGGVRIDGSPGVMPLAVALVDAYRVQHPSAAVTTGAGLGTRARLEALAQGRIDVALASHGIDTTELARQGLVAHEVAQAAVVFATHAGVPVAGLTTAQLCDVYAGRVTDWAQLGGPALAIAPRTRPAGEVDADVVTAGVPCLKDAARAAGVQTVDTPEAMAAALAATPGAVGMTSLPFVLQSGGRLRALALDGVTPGAESVRRGTWRLTRRSVFVTRAAPPPAVAHFLAFVRGAAGAGVIEASGAVAVQR